MEQWVNNKFCFKLGKMSRETYEMLQTVYGDDTLGRSCVSEWFKWYENGCEDLQDDPRSRRFSTSRNAETGAWAQKTKTNIMPKFHPNLSRQSKFSWLHLIFPKEKAALEGKRLQNAEHIKKIAMAELNAVQSEAFADSFQKLFKRFNRCIQVRGDHFQYS